MFVYQELGIYQIKELIQIYMLVETDLQNFLNPSAFVFVFVTDGCVERVVDVLVEEEEVVKEHDQQPSCDQDSIQVLLHKIHSLPSLGNAYGNGVQRCHSVYIMNQYMVLMIY